MTKANQTIWCNDGTKVFQLPYLQYMELIETYKQKYGHNYNDVDNTITIVNTYKEHNYILRFGGLEKSALYFCGYVENVPNDIKYEPHGEFTGGITHNGTYYAGFDCAHMNDFYGNKNLLSSNVNRTFKTEEFVHLECQKIIDNLFFKDA